MKPALAIALGALAGGGAVGCGGGDAGPEPAFPADYAASFREVRGCRASSDHELNKVRVVADPAAFEPYTTRAAAFPEGAIVLKEEYDFADGACAGAIVRWTVMQRSAAHPGGWLWQDLDGDRHVVSQDDALCVSCHAGCGRPPDGYEGTCEVP